MTHRMIDSLRDMGMVMALSLGREDKPTESKWNYRFELPKAEGIEGPFDEKFGYPFHRPRWWWGWFGAEEE